MHEGMHQNLSLCFELLSHHSLQDRSTIRRVDHGTEIIENARAPRRRDSHLRPITPPVRVRAFKDRYSFVAGKDESNFRIAKLVYPMGS